MDGLEVGSINLLLLPLLGGYWFLYKFVGTHYRAERLTPQRLIFHAGLFALFLVAVARSLIYTADSQWQPEDFWVELLMFGVTPAFIGLVFLALIVTAVRDYSLGPSDEASRRVDSPPLPSIEGDISPMFELARTSIGVVIAVILSVVAWFISSAIQNVVPMAPELYGIGIFIVLLITTRSYHEFINRYLAFPFNSIALRIGLFGVIASMGFTVLLFRSPWIYSLWDHIVHVKGSGIPVVACLLGLIMWWPLNLLYPYQAANSRLHETNGTTALDRLLYQASLAQHLLSISMKDGKVYIGYIQELPPNPEDRNSYFEILPVHSGYRDKDSREMKLTTFYESAYERLVQSNADPEKWLVFLKVLKIEDIVSAGRFDPEAYVQFQGEKTPHQEHEGWQDSSG
jgi:hypothetical protein